MRSGLRASAGTPKGLCDMPLLSVAHPITEDRRSATNGRPGAGIGIGERTWQNGLARLAYAVIGNPG